MQTRTYLLVALIAATAGLLGSRAGDALVKRMESTSVRRIDHRPPGPAPPGHTWGEDVYQTFHAGSAKNSPEGKNNLGARRWTLYKRSAGQIGGADRIVIYNNSPGDGIARSAVVFGVAPTNSTGDEGVELDRPEIWNFGNVPTGRLERPAAAGSKVLRLRLDRSDHSRFLGAEQWVVLTSRSEATRVAGFERSSKSWHAAKGSRFPAAGEFPKRAFALETSRYADRSGNEVMDWLEVGEGSSPTRLRTVHIAQGRDQGAPVWYSMEGETAHRLENAPGVRNGYTAPAVQIAGLTVPVHDSGEASGGIVEIVLHEALPAALPKGERVEVHSGGPPHATFLSHQLSYCRRGNRCYGNMLNAHYSSRPLEFGYATHSSGDVDFGAGYAFKTSLRSRFARSAVEHWYEKDERNYDRRASTFASLRAEQGWGKESYTLFDFNGRKTRIVFDSAAGVLRLVHRGKRYRLQMIED